MVNRIDEELFICPECGNEDKSYDEAICHIANCIDTPEPDNKTETFYICEICKGYHDTYSQASDCEEKHHENKDLAYQEMIDYQKKELLRDASMHHEQQRLI